MQQSNESEAFRMATQSGPADVVRAFDQDPNLQNLVLQLEHPEHQGILLETRDYVLLGIATIIIPILLTVWGALAS